MQPAKEERAEGAAVVALRAEIEQQKQGCQHEAGDDSIAQRSKDLSHFHSPRRISPTRREVLCGSADFTLRRLDESGPECFGAEAGNCRGRSEEHTSELQSLIRTSYTAFRMKQIHTSTAKVSYQQPFHNTNHKLMRNHHYN